MTASGLSRTRTWLLVDRPAFRPAGTYRRRAKAMASAFTIYVKKPDPVRARLTAFRGSVIFAIQYWQGPHGGGGAIEIENAKALRPLALNAC